jgi:hypothetical protein
VGTWFDPILDDMPKGVDGPPQNLFALAIFNSDRDFLGWVAGAGGLTPDVGVARKFNLTSDAAVWLDEHSGKIPAWHDKAAYAMLMDIRRADRIGDVIVLNRPEESNGNPSHVTEGGSS